MIKHYYGEKYGYAYPGDVDGLERKHNHAFWYCDPKPISEYPECCQINPRKSPYYRCSAVPFMHVEEIDYKELLANALRYSGLCKPENIERTKKEIADAFTLLGTDIDTWYSKEEDNEYFRRLYWCVYLTLSLRECIAHMDDIDFEDMNWHTYGADDRYCGYAVCAFDIMQEDMYPGLLCRPLLDFDYDTGDNNYQYCLKAYGII